MSPTPCRNWPPQEDAQADPAPSAVAGACSPGGRLSPIAALRVATVGGEWEVMPWHFLGIPLGGARA